MTGQLPGILSGVCAAFVYGVALAEPLSDQMWPASAADDGSLSSFDRAQSHVLFTHENAAKGVSSDIGAASAQLTNNYIARANRLDSKSAPFATAVSYKDSSDRYAGAGDAAPSPSKVSNVTSSWLTRDASWSERSHDSFMEIAFQEARGNACQMLGPDPAYVDEMLVRFGDDGSKSYERRVALVVGNSAYENGVDRLKNPSNDATSMARVLRALGFTVHRGIDLDTRELEACLASFNKDLETTPADVALFYYAGHGVQLTSAADNEKRNYMLATDAKVDASGKGKGFKQIDAVLSQMRQHSSQSVFFYDACRNDPLGDAKPRTIDGVAIKRLARIGAAEINVEEAAAEDRAGIYIAYAAAPNRVADDAYEKGADHSPFTRALLNRIATPGASLESVMNQVTLDVVDFTDSGQVPWKRSSLKEDVKLNGVIAEREIASRSSELASQSTVFREQGLKARAIASGLKGISRTWIDGDGANKFAFARAALYRAFDTAEVQFVGHMGQVHDANFSLDSMRVVTGSADETAKIWDSTTGALMATLRGHEDDVKTANFSPNGARVVTTSYDGTARVWDAMTAAHLKTLAFDGARLKNAAFSTNGKKIVSVDSRTVKFWDAEKGALLQTVQFNWGIIDWTAFSPNLSRLVTVSRGNSSKIWDVHTGKLITTLGGEQDEFNTAVFSSNGRNVATGSEDGLVKIWDATNGVLQQTIKAHKDSVWSIAFSPNSGHLLTGSRDGTVRIWDIQTGELMRNGMKDIGRSVSSVTYSPSGRKIVIGSWDKTAHIWDTTTGMPVRTIAAHKSIIWSTDYSFERDLVLTGSSDGTAKIWDTTTGELCSTFEFESDLIGYAAFSEDGGRVVTVSDSGTLKIWDANTSALLRTIEDHQVFGLSAAFSPDGQYIVAPSFTAALLVGSAKIWDAATGVLLMVLQGHDSVVSSVAFSPNGRHMATGSWDKTAKIWDATSGLLLKTFEGHNGIVASVAFSPDGKRLATGSHDNTVKIWNAATGIILTTLSGHRGEIHNVRYNANGRLLATASEDKSAKIWDATTTALLKTLDGHAGGVASVAFSPRTSQIATGSADSTAKIWDTGLYGPELLEAAYDLLTDDLRAEVERERIRYWELEPEFLN